MRVPATCFAGCVLLVGGMSGQDWSVRHNVVIPMPTRLSVERTPDRLAVAFDLTSSPRNVKIQAGKLMTLGVKYEMRVYAEGSARPADATGTTYGNINEPVNLSNAGSLNGTNFLNTTQGGIPVAGTTYIVEEDMSIFETDIPAQHLWRPNSNQYKVLWENKLQSISVGE